MIEAYYTEDDMLDLLETDPDLACLVARDAAKDLVETLENIVDVHEDLEDYQKNIYLMAKIIIYLTSDMKYDIMRTH